MADSIGSLCGLYDCAECVHAVEGKCAGCRETNARSRAQAQPVCRVFECVESRGFVSCEQCRDAVCALRRNVATLCPLRAHYEKQRWWAGRMSRFLSSRRGAGLSDEGRMSPRVVSRLRWYLLALDTLEAEGRESVSSWQLSERVGVSAALIRKDLSRFGDFGTPSFGYRTEHLQERIRGILRLDRHRAVVWVGACAMRHYAAALQRLGRNNCSIVGVFDIDEHEIGTALGQFRVEPAERMAEVLAGVGVSAATIAVPGPRAQEVAATAVSLGAKAVLNMSGELLVLPDHVRVSSLDIAGELLELCYYC